MKSISILVLLLFACVLSGGCGSREDGAQESRSANAASDEHGRVYAEARSRPTARRASPLHRSLLLLDLSRPPFVAGNVGVSFTPAIAK